MLHLPARKSPQRSHSQLSWEESWHMKHHSTAQHWSACSSQVFHAGLAQAGFFSIPRQKATLGLADSWSWTLSASADILSKSKTYLKTCLDATAFN